MKKSISKNLHEEILLENIDEIMAVAHAVQHRYDYVKRAFAGDEIPQCYHAELKIWRKFLLMVYGKID